MTISSGELTYTTPLPSYRVKSTGPAHPSALGMLSQWTETPNPYTDKKIEGFHWNKRIWSDETNDNNVNSLPYLWDATSSGITSTYFQSGIGDNKDLEVFNIQEVISSGVNREGVFNVWAPEINHGYYYDFDDEGYLFSDDSEVLYPTFSGVVQGLGDSYLLQSGFQYIVLSEIPKTGIPVRAEQYTWDGDLGIYETNLAIRSKVEFLGKYDSNSGILPTYNANKDLFLWDQIDRTVDEFTVYLTSGNDYWALFNKNYSVQVGDLADLQSGLEVLGESTGGASQRFHTEYSPVDSGMGVTIYSYLVASGTMTRWYPIDIEDEFSLGQYEAKVDYDLGIIEFPDSTTSGMLVPPVGHKIAAHYYKTIKLEYEPQNTLDTVLATEVSVNPVYRRSARGFVHLKTKDQQPESIVLTSELPELDSNDTYGPLYIGNNYATLVATVYDADGEIIEDETVTFTIKTTPLIGGFGSTSNDVSSVTDAFGQAFAFYQPPAQLFELGESVTSSGFTVTTDPIGDGYLSDNGNYDSVAEATVFRTTNLAINGSLEDIFLYEVRMSDPILGYLESGASFSDEEAQIVESYRQWFIDQDIFGPTGLTATSGIYTGPSSFTSVDWEANRRLSLGLQTPDIFGDPVLDGQKVLVSALDPLALNPHTLQSGTTVAPVYPIAVNTISDNEYDIIYNTTDYEIRRPSASDPVPSGYIYAYFIVAPTNVTVQASVFDERRNQTLYSNEIDVKLDIPGYLRGTWIIDAINQNQIDEISSALSSITANGQKVPFGFRLRSSSVTLAAALNGVTFLDVNPRFDNDIYDEDQLSSTRLGFYFKVV